MEQRNALAAVLTAVALAGCGGSDGGNCTASPAPAIRSFPPTVATVGRQYIYDVDAVAACFLVLCGPLQLQNVPPGAQASRNFVFWTPSASDANTTVGFRIATPEDVCGNSVAQSWNVQVFPAPSVTSFTAASTTVSAGQSATLTAVYAGGSGVIEGVGPIASGVPFTTSALMTDRTFTLVVSNPAGVQVRQSIFIDVT